jgi:lactate dehydrogenase-like 2-hydroxyacid dehydrogenase
MTEAKPKLLVTRKLPDAVLERAGRDFDARLNADDVPHGPEQLVALGAGMDAILAAPGDPLTAQVIDGLDNSVRIIATFSVGYEHIDADAAKARGIAVTNTPGVLTESTAEIAMLLLLGAARRGSEGDALVRAKGWRGWTPTQLLGVQVSGKRLGIVGMGRIGHAVARRARAFGMTIHYHNRNRLPPGEEEGATYHAALDDMLPHCDFLSLHCLVTPETQKLLDARAIAKLPDGAVVVNSARGAVVDDTALIDALKSGKLAAAGLDVYEGEPDLDPGYLGLANTFLLPHLGSATIETRNAMGFKALDNLDAFFRDEAPPDRVA